MDPSSGYHQQETGVMHRVSGEHQAINAQNLPGHKRLLLRIPSVVAGRAWRIARVVSSRAWSVYLKLLGALTYLLRG